jgi:hypothetical protein
MAKLLNRTIVVTTITNNFLAYINKSYNILELFEGYNIDKQPMKSNHVKLEKRKWKLFQPTTGEIFSFLP